MYPLASSQGKFCLSKNIIDYKGTKLIHLRSLDCTGLHGGNATELCTMRALSIGYLFLLVLMLELVWKNSVQYVIAF